MFEIIFYRDSKGNEPVKDYILSLFEGDNKDNRIKGNKFRDCIKVLKQNGTRAGRNYVKHLQGKLWELKVLKDRVIFFTYTDNTIVLLSCFRKKTQKTPKREIEKAEKLMTEYTERSKQ
ncbi:MAG TPA: hypothetical protein DCW90_06050 [Lachnospiraceae bacterium]|nr:hypothetical protein [Lachnospiraceae bacterium]